MQLASHFHTVGKVSAPILFSRLSEIEKIQIRGANEARLQWLANNPLRGETHGDISLAKEVKALVDAEFEELTKLPGFTRTYAF